MSKRTKAMRKRAREAQQRFAAAVAISCPRRELNGRLSRRKEDVRHRVEMTEAEAKAVMIAVRMRATGLDEKTVDIVDAGKPNVGTVHGLMCIQKHITVDQFDAAEWFIAKRSAWARAIEAPGEPNASREGAHFDEEAHAAFCAKAKEQWAEIIACLQQASVENRSPVIAALDCILIRQVDMGHMLGDLRIGLNALRREFL